MANYYGKIKKEDIILIENVFICLGFKKDSKSTLTEWYGTFKLDNMVNITPADNPYQLILNDGRSGSIFINHIGAKSSGNFFFKFSGSGPLK